MKLNKIIRKLSLSILVLVFAVGSLTAQDKVVDQIVAVVGGNIILKSDIERMYMDQQAQGITSDGDMKCEILENYLVNKLLIAEAELDTLITVTPGQVNQQMDAQIEFYISQLGSENAVEEYFGQSLAEVRSGLQEDIRNDILSSQMQNKIVQDVTATPSEVRQFYRELDEEDIPVIPAEYEYAQITLVPEIELEEINRVKQQLREFKQRIEDGASFAALAIARSEGPSASDGGELGYYGRAGLDPAYAAAAFNLRDDQISNVVESEYGFHIIQLIDRDGEQVNTRHILLRPKPTPEAREQAVERLDSLANVIRKNEIEFEDAARLLSFDDDTRNNGGLVINPNTLSSKFTAQELDPDASRVLTGLNIGEISDPFESINPNSRQSEYKIIKLVNKTEAHRANLENDYQLIAQQFLAQKKQKVLEDWISDRQANTYIRIDDTYANCNFEYNNWIK